MCKLAKKLYQLHAKVVGTTSVMDAVKMVMLISRSQSWAMVGRYIQVLGGGLAMGVMALKAPRIMLGAETSVNPPLVVPCSPIPETTLVPRVVSFTNRQVARWILLVEFTPPTRLDRGSPPAQEGARMVMKTSQPMNWATDGDYTQEWVGESVTVLVQRAWVTANPCVSRHLVVE